MHKPPQFSDLPNRIVVPVTPHRRATRAQLLVSFVLALPIIALVTVVVYFLKGR